MRKHLSLVIRIVLLIMLAAVGAMCIFWMPAVVDYAAGFLTWASRPILYAVGGMIALVMAVVIGMAFRLPWAIDADCIFHVKTARLLKRIAFLIGGDCVFFGVASAALWAAGDGLLAPALLFVDGIGLALTLMLWVLSDYVGRAAVLKEEADGTL